jgi:hypothetical protein
MGPKKGICIEQTGGREAEREAESGAHGIATLFRCILSDVVKSLSIKCLLHKSLYCSFLPESILLDNPMFLAHNKAL